MRKFYVYIHEREDTGEVFYVGKGCGNRAYRKDSRNTIWKNITRKSKHSTKILYKNLSEDLAYKLEEFLIEAYKINNLAKANISSGGAFSASGIPCPEHVKEILIKVNSGKNSTVAKSVIDTKTGKTWDTVSQAAKDNNMKQPVLSRKLNGTRHNNTSLKYLEE